MMSVRKSVLDRFVQLGGYDIVEKRENGSWKGISKAQRKTGLSRPTIYNILKAYPEPPDKTLPKYVKEFRETEGYARVLEMYQRRDFLKDVMYAAREGWKLLNKKDAISWTEQDYRKIWNSERFIDKVTNYIQFNISVNFRRIMKATGKHEFLAKFPTKSRPTGAKKLWFLHDDEIKRIAAELPTCDIVIQTLRGITEGARHSALCTTTPEKINEKERVLMVYESKIKKWVEKVHTDKVMQLIMRYVKDFNIKGKLHPRTYDYYKNQLQDAAKRAGITKNVTTHILKHTFVSQAHAHGVSAETVVDQCHTELRTLVAFYRAGDEKKKRHELRGEEYNVTPFHEWIETVIYPAFEKRYEELRKA